MAFECNTTAVAIDPVSHYRDCVAVVNMAFQVYSLNPPIQLNAGANMTFDMYIFILSQVATNCTAAWNEIEAAGDGPNYNQEWLAELHVACAEQLQPASQWIMGRMSNDPEVRNCLSAINGVVAAFADPLNIGYPDIPNPFGAAAAQGDGSSALRAVVGQQPVKRHMPKRRVKGVM